MTLRATVMYGISFIESNSQRLNKIVESNNKHTQTHTKPINTLEKKQLWSPIVGDSMWEEWLVFFGSGGDARKFWGDSYNRVIDGCSPGGGRSLCKEDVGMDYAQIWIIFWQNPLAIAILLVELLKALMEWLLKVSKVINKCQIIEGLRVHIGGLYSNMYCRPTTTFQYITVLFSGHDCY